MYDVEYCRAEAIPPRDILKRRRKGFQILEVRAVQRLGRWITEVQGLQKRAAFENSQEVSLIRSGTSDYWREEDCLDTRSELTNSAIAFSIARLVPNSGRGCKP